MLEIKNTEDLYFKELMSKSKLELPFSDFEDNVMLQIENSVLHRKDVKKKLKLSWISFVAGSICGMVASFFIQQLQEPIFGIQPANLSILFQAVFAAILFTQLDTLIKFSKRISSET